MRTLTCQNHLRGLEKKVKKNSTKLYGHVKMAKWKNLILILLELTGTHLLLFVQGVAKINHLQRTTPTANEETAPHDTDRTAENAALKGEEKTGRGQYIRQYSPLKAKNVKSALLKSTLMSFMQTGVLPMALKNTAVVAKNACLQDQNKNSQNGMKQKLRSGRLAQKTLSRGFLITLLNVSNTWGSILTLSICSVFTKVNKADAPYQVSK